MHRRRCRKMPRHEQLLKKPYCAFASWNQLLKKSGFRRSTRKWQACNLRSWRHGDFTRVTERVSECRINQRVCTYTAPRFHKHSGSSPTLREDTLAILDSTRDSCSCTISSVIIHIDPEGSRFLSVLQSPCCMFLVGLDYRPGGRVPADRLSGGIPDAGAQSCCRRS